MGQCPHCDAEITVEAELVPASDAEDDHTAVPDDGTIMLEQGVRMFQYVCPECDVIVGVGTHKWAR